MVFSQVFTRFGNNITKMNLQMKGEIGERWQKNSTHNHPKMEQNLYAKFDEM